MIAVDTNILIYAHRRESHWHEVALGVMASLTQQSAPWAIPWPCIHEFLAIVTNPRVYKPPSPFTVALTQVEYWSESNSLRLLGEGPRHWAHLKSLITTGRIEGSMVHDARIAAVCREHGVTELWTGDRDFARMGIKTRNPLLDPNQSPS